MKRSSSISCRDKSFPPSHHYYGPDTEELHGQSLLPGAIGTEANIARLGPVQRVPALLALGKEARRGTWKQPRQVAGRQEPVFQVQREHSAEPVLCPMVAANKDNAGKRVCRAGGG
jgi:hypothetical protein